MTFRGRRKPAPLRERIDAVLEVLDVIAARDGERARKRYGVGFSKADSRRGHMLSKFSVDATLRDPALLSDVLKMAAKYQRQASKTRGCVEAS